ncbi:MAG: V-type ATP synthase subunit D [Ectothiorhodospiraceae bacterium]|nr:V-type ATP synthase subunit D [Ectothiorhodospiraceae bacterium]
MRLSLNKNALKRERDHLAMYRRYLPSLDLKRQQLARALKEAQELLGGLHIRGKQLQEQADRLLPSLGSSTVDPDQLRGLIKVRDVVLREENVVGAKLPVVVNITIERTEYSRLTLPFWVDQFVESMEAIVRHQIHLQIGQERIRVLGVAARKITQRVNLFEKVLIPKAEANIRQISVALADQERASVVRSKLAKKKHRRTTISE